MKKSIFLSIFGVIVIVALISFIFSIGRSSDNSITFRYILDLISNFKSIPFSNVFQSNLIVGDWGFFEFLKVIFNAFISVFNALIFIFNNLINVIKFLLYFITGLFYF